MNSLVVLLSLAALAAAKPSGLLTGPAITYSAPLIAAVPAAVSHQSRLDIKSSPAIVSTAAVAPIAVRTALAQPTVFAAPAAVVAPAAVSSQSRLDIKSTPAVTSTLVSGAPLAYSAISAPITTAAITPLAATAIAPALLSTFTPAIAAPSFVKTAQLVPAAIEAPAVPLDTPEVVAARAAHLEAKAQALADAHVVHKRSVVASVYSTSLGTPVVSTYSAAPVVSTHLTYSAPIATPLVTKTYGIHTW